MPKARLCLCLVLLAGLVACIERTSTSRPFVFAGPMDLPLHEDITPKSKVVVRVHHGDKLEVVQQRRRLYKLRTGKGAEGWTDERNLMSVDQMKALAEMEASARRLPSQGVAISYEPLNVHTEPQRYSPTFIQIREGDKFDVMAHQISPRAEPAHRVLVKPQPRPDTKSRKRADHGRRNPPPPPPPQPAPPDDWLELSQEREPPAPPVSPEEDQEPVPSDDWTLVRTSSGAAGWVLTNRIYLAIPDEVAQYAEGHRITTYFSLGKIHDDELNTDKNFWLWTTVHSGQHPYDFDSFRVFTWNPKRHRYETAYIQRSVEGYLPVLVKKEGGQETFSVCLADDDGARLRKRYTMLDRQVRPLDAEPCPAPAVQPSAAPASAAAPPEAAPAKSSVTEKLKEKAEAVKKRILGR